MIYSNDSSDDRRRPGGDGDAGGQGQGDQRDDEAGEEVVAKVLEARDAVAGLLHMLLVGGAAGRGRVYITHRALSCSGAFGATGPREGPLLRVPLLDNGNRRASERGFV